MHGTQEDIRQPYKGHYHDGNRLEEGCDKCQRGGEKAVAGGILLSVGPMEDLYEYHQESNSGLELPARVDSGKGGGGDEI